MPQTTAELISTRRHAKLAHKENVYKLISDSYKGGADYLAGGHLWKHPREFEPEYKARKKRTVFLNHVQPLADMLAGFIFSQDVEGMDKLPDEIIEAMKEKQFPKFRQKMATQSELMPAGVLVDMPNFDPATVPSEADRTAAGIYPYCVLYAPDKIRDYDVGDDGSIIWVLLDNSYVDKTNPLTEPVSKKVYRLWTTTDYTDFTWTKKTNGEFEFVSSDSVPHNLSVCPFLIVNWRDVDNDMVAESPFEDIAIMDRAIYNYFSLLDEMLASGTFKQLFFPTRKKGDLPTAFKAVGASSLSVVPFPADSSKAPYYDGAGLEDINSFIQAIELYLKEIFSKLGLDKDHDKKYVQSGVAKTLEFEKAESFLRQGARSLQAAENKIIEFMGLWMRIEIPEDAQIVYQTQFQKEDIDMQLRRLYELFAVPLKSVSEYAIERIISLLAFDQDKDKLLKAVEAELKISNSPAEPDTLKSEGDNDAI